MAKKFIAYSMIVFVVSFLGCYLFIKYTDYSPGKGSSTVEPGISATPEPSKQETPRPTATPDPIKLQISQMSLEEKIGQMMIVGLDGYTLNDAAKKMIETYRVGGFIIMGDNVQNANQLLALVNALKRANTKNKIPLFISVDEEGGRVSRMPGELKRLPANKVIGQANNKEFSYKIGSVIAQEIKSFGFNMDFAPVLDINSNPRNPVIGDRSFSAKADIVSALGVQTMKGIQAEKIIPVVKHFPGHGDTTVDSHIGLPSVTHDLSRLKSFELVPFAEAVKSNADAVMVAHILVQSMDAKNPASLSKAVITDVLRKDLNFSGVVITDDMTMGAIQKNYSIAEAAVQSVNAGSDIILVCHGNENATAVMDRIRNAVEKGTIPQDRIEESVYRVLKLKQKYGLTDETRSSVDSKGINNKINEILNAYLSSSK